MAITDKLTSALHPKREHSLGSAAVLLMFATLLARIVGYLRDAYVAWAFGAGPSTDAYIAAFTLPDFLLYLFAGGSISITFVSLYTRYLAEGKQDEAEHVFSSIISIMLVAFGIAVVLGEIFARRFVAWWFGGFTPDQIDLCTQLTRYLLPQPVFFMVGGVASAVQQTRRQFLIPAVAPIVYTLFVILGGVVLSGRFGIASLAIGATTGALFGPFLLNAYGARHAGVHYHFRFDWRHEGFRQWLRMSVPLMLGVSVVAADDWILRVFAASGAGDITRLNYAKRLLQVPIGVLGQAAGLASLPFFARLWSERKHEDFAATVNRSITKLSAICLLATSWMIVVAAPLTDLAFRRGRFALSDAHETASLFVVFAASLVFWAVQGLYARAFFAAGDMLRPMLAGTIVTIASIPVYALLDRRFGVLGLVIASNVAIFAHTTVLALMLQLRGMVSMRGLDWHELGKALIAGAVAGFVAHSISGVVPFTGARLSAISNLFFVSLTWMAASFALLSLARADLLRDLRRRATA
jgi:putative peptidoglycan lipid II flippase